MSDETAQIERERQRIIDLCAAIQEKVARPMSDAQRQLVMRDLSRVAAALGLETAAAPVDSASVLGLTDGLTHATGLNAAGLAHQHHDALAVLLEEEFQLAHAGDQIEADTLA